MTKHAMPRVVLILAVSGRALAAAARRSGLTPLVVDCFADRDTRMLAGGWRKLDGDLSCGLEADGAIEGLERLESEAPQRPLGLICGSGLEAQPELLDRLGERWRLIGNTAETTRRTKDPARFFRALDQLGISHPTVSLTPPPQPRGWLRKRRGGAGGGHIIPADNADAADPGGLHYYQRRIEGRSVSTALIADGREAQVFGFSEQWVSPAPGRPMRYGGAAQPATLGVRDEAAMRDATRGIASAFGLRGLGSVDFMVGDDGPQALEVNARPGATLDIFNDGETRLIDAHIGTVGGSLRPGLRTAHGARAAAVAYADYDLAIPPSLDWPDWAADIPHPGERIGAQRPICTVLAEAATAEDAKRLVAARLSAIVKKIEPSGRKPR